MVASTHWLASAAGMAVLEQGGNAFDAAVATGLPSRSSSRTSTAPAATCPPSSGRPAASEPLVLCAQGPAPRAATIERFRDELGLDAGSGDRTTRGGRARAPSAAGSRCCASTGRCRSPTCSRSRSPTPRTATRLSPRSATRSAARTALSRRLDDVRGGLSPAPRAGRAAPQPARSPRPTVASCTRPSRPHDRDAQLEAPTTAGTAASSRRRSSASRSASGSTAPASAMPACSPGTTCATGRRPGRNRSRSTTTATRSSRPARGARRRSSSSSSGCSRGSTSGPGPGERRVGAHHHRVREARVRRPRSLVRRPGLRGRAARRAALAGLRGGAAAAARRGGLAGAPSRLTRRPRAPAPPPVADAPVAPGVGEPTRGDTVHLDVVDRSGNMVSATPSGGWLGARR